MYVCVCVYAQSCPTLCGPMDYTAHPAPLSIGFSKQEYWSGLPLPLPGDLPNPRIRPVFLESPALQLDSLLLVPPGKPKYSINMWLNIAKYSIFLKWDKYMYILYMDVSPYKYHL